MTDIPRRDFLKSVPAAALAIGATAGLTSLEAAPQSSGATIRLETFDYGSVTLLPSRWQQQVEEARAFYRGISNDDILHGFRKAAHLPAPGKPLGDIRSFVERFRACTGYGPLPPVILATLRKRMVALAGEIGDGLVFSSGCRSHMAESLACLPAAKRADPTFFIGNRIRTCIDDDIGRAKAT